MQMISRSHGKGKGIRPRRSCGEILRQGTSGGQELLNLGQGQQVHPSIVGYNMVTYQHGALAPHVLLRKLRSHRHEIGILKGHGLLAIILHVELPDHGA